MKYFVALALLAAGAAEPVRAADQASIATARAMLGKSVAFATVEGRGQVPAYAEYIAGELRAAGFAPADVVVERFGETAALTATYRGKSGAKPIILNAHMDVVEAKREDWVRDPFVMTEDDGYLFGRGTSDNKFDIVMIVRTFAELKRSGFRPSRDIVLALTGDEESTQKTTAALAPRFRNAELVLNGDGGGGLLNSDGTPLYYSLQTSEKTYADFKLEVTNPGGHSSEPHGDNAIAVLAGATERIASFQFPVRSNETTRAFFAATAKQMQGELGKAMAEFAANPVEGAAAATLSGNPDYLGRLRTTCVPTMIEGGHAPNALPQRAGANINCRVFPGTTIAEVEAQLRQLAGEKITVTIAEVFPEGSLSPLRQDLLRSLSKAIAAGRGEGVTIVPSMASYTTDCAFFRQAGIPCYGVGSLFMRSNDVFSHGLNERVPVAAIGPALDHYRVLITELAK